MSGEFVILTADSLRLGRDQSATGDKMHKGRGCSQMSKRTNTAQWEEKYQRWRIAVQKDGVRKQFYSSTPGRTGQREANAKADRWLDDGIGVKARRVEDLYQEWYATVVKTTGTGNQRNVESRWRTRILPAIGRKRITSLTEQDLQDVVNDAYSDGLAKCPCNPSARICGHSANGAVQRS